MAITDQIAGVISRIVNELDSELSEKIITQLELGNLTKQSAANTWTRLLTPYFIPTPLLVDLLESWKQIDIDSNVLAFSIRCALETKRQAYCRFPKIELAWTGPYNPSTSLVRGTYSLMSEMIENAQNSILLVGYSFTATSDTTRNIIRKLSEAHIRGCAVKIALHDDGFNHENVKKAWPPNKPLPMLLKWKGNSNDTMASLHAKLLCIDQKEIFITSANMTYHGLDSNIELGVKIQGEEAKLIARHFASLERSRILRRI
ncbi:phospholipase D-like domain-containing protein [Paenibacillus sp. 843]|uniref:phospholipase D-like domain-containing protein n=1 Tax=Paenibacillus sp. 843 TaxID=3341795 RepID=UPI0037271851